MNRPDLGRLFQEERSYLMGIAYRLLGTVTDAEDALQEAWARLWETEPGCVMNPRHWLATVVARVCLDSMKSARARREAYVGPWLPEPMMKGPDPSDRVTLDESVSMAMLVMFESLTPAERTAFVLHDVFGMPFSDVAPAVGRTAAACRQLASRARRSLTKRGRRYSLDATQHKQAVKAFISAGETGSLEALVSALDPDVLFQSDGGGRVQTIAKPLWGVETVSRVLMTIRRRRPDMVMHMVGVNGSYGLLTEERGRVTGVMGFSVRGGRIAEIDMVMNPEKVRHVGVPSIGTEGPTASRKG